MPGANPMGDFNPYTAGLQECFELFSPPQQQSPTSALCCLRTYVLRWLLRGVHVRENAIITARDNVRHLLFVCFAFNGALLEMREFDETKFYSSFPFEL